MRQTRHGHPDNRGMHQSRSPDPDIRRPEVFREMAAGCTGRYVRCRSGRPSCVGQDLSECPLPSPPQTGTSTLVYTRVLYLSTGYRTCTRPPRQSTRELITCRNSEAGGDQLVHTGGVPQLHSSHQSSETSGQRCPGLRSGRTRVTLGSCAPLAMPAREPKPKYAGHFHALGVPLAASVSNGVAEGERCAPHGLLLARSCGRTSSSPSPSSSHVPRGAGRG